MFYSKRIAPVLLVIFALFAGPVTAQDDSGDGGGGRSEGRGRGGFGRRGGGGGEERGGERGGGERGGGERGGGERGGGERGGGERFGGGRGGFGGGGFNPAEMFDRLDTNKNGQIEPSERTGRTGQMVEGMAKRAGLDPTKPVSIQKLRETMSSFGRGGPDGGKPGEGKDKPADPKAAEAKAAEEKAAADKKAKPSFPGFGTKATVPAVPGFGEVATADKADKSKSGESPRGRGGFGGRGGEGRGDRRGGDRSGDDDSPADEAPVSSENKTRNYAESLFKRYDANKNGTLEKEEWSQMSGQPEKADKNGDGKVTLDELADSLASFGKGDDGGPSGKGSSGGGFSSRTGSKGGKPNRFLTATERLPSGLPGWFTRNDADGDGQVMMAEYATTWTTAKVAEFTQYDLNGDGVITPQECLTVDKKGGDKKLADKPPTDKK